MSNWYEHAVFYELYTRAFCDSNDDGFGDFGGVLQKLDYISDLGIDAIWFPPFYESPLRDGGYDISDYMTVDPRYGTNEDFIAIISKAHSLGIKVMLDLVINHTSDRHQWFVESENDPTGPYGDYYVWRDDDKGYANTRVIFSATEDSNWAWSDTRQQYYWHRFYKEQPDLNFDCPAVHEEIFKIADFWAERGVDGFRLDAIPYLYEREGTASEGLPETHAFIASLRKHLDQMYGGRIALLAEATAPITENIKYFGSEAAPECNMCFNFVLMAEMFAALKSKDASGVKNTAAAAFSNLPPGAAWSNFLRNHDFLTFERLAPDEAKRMERLYAPPEGSLNGDIARRLAPLLDYDLRQLLAITALLISLPGAPCWYYGDEILMADNPALPDRDSVRLPMPWADVDKAAADPTSFFSMFKEMLLNRRQDSALLQGDFNILPSPASVFKFKRMTPSGDSTIFSIDFETLSYKWEKS